MQTSKEKEKWMISLKFGTSRSKDFSNLKKNIHLTIDSNKITIVTRDALINSLDALMNSLGAKINNITIIIAKDRIHFEKQFMLNILLF